MQCASEAQRGQPFRLFIGFIGTTWEVEYRRSLLELTRQTAIERESALDPMTLLHVVTCSIDHDRAQSAIATEFAEEVRMFLDELFDLGLKVGIERYKQSCILGRMIHPPTAEELVTFVDQKMVQRCGFIPDYATPVEGIDPVEWLLWCAEAMEHGPDHIPGDEVQDHLAHQYRQTGDVLRHMRAALNTDALKTRLSRPVDCILERVRSWG